MLLGRKDRLYHHSCFSSYNSLKSITLLDQNLSKVFMTGLVELGSLPENKDKSRTFSLSDFRENRSLGQDPARLWLEQGWQSSIEHRLLPS